MQKFIRESYKYNNELWCFRIWVALSKCYRLSRRIRSSCYSFNTSSSYINWIQTTKLWQFKLFDKRRTYFIKSSILILLVRIWSNKKFTRSLILSLSRCKLERINNWRSDIKWIFQIIKSYSWPNEFRSTLWWIFQIFSKRHRYSCNIFTSECQYDSILLRNYNSTLALYDTE